MGKESSLQKVDLIDSQAFQLMGDLQTTVGWEQPENGAGWPAGKRDGRAWQQSHLHHSCSSVTFVAAGSLL